MMFTDMDAIRGLFTACRVEQRKFFQSKSLLTEPYKDGTSLVMCFDTLFVIINNNGVIHVAGWDLLSGYSVRE